MKVFIGKLVKFGAANYNNTTYCKTEFLDSQHVMDTYKMKKLKETLVSFYFGERERERANGAQSKIPH